MFSPSKTDCINILSLAEQLRPGELAELDCEQLGLSRHYLENVVLFLIERDCFTQYQTEPGHYVIGPLSQQGRWRLEQLNEEE